MDSVVGEFWFTMWIQQDRSRTPSTRFGQVGFISEMKYQVDLTELLGILDASDGMTDVGVQRI